MESQSTTSIIDGKISKLRQVRELLVTGAAPAKATKKADKKAAPKKAAKAAPAVAMPQAQKAEAAS